MRGSTVKRGRTWSAVFYEAKDADGRRKQVWRGGFKRKCDAEAYLAEMFADIGRGTYVKPSEQPFGEYLDEWLASHSEELQPLSIMAYESKIRLHVRTRPWLAQIPLQHLTADHIDRLLRELTEAGSSPGSRTNMRSMLGKALKDAAKRRRIAYNPVPDSKRPKDASGELGEEKLKVWQPSEVAKFLAHVEGDRFEALYRLAATTGMRRGELIGVTWHGLDLEQARLHTYQQVVPTKGGATLRRPKTKKSDRWIALDLKTVEALRDHRDAQLVERSLWGDAYCDHDLVFCKEDGSIYNPQRLTAQFGEHVTASRLPRITLHGLRHTWITLALTNGVPLHVVSARVGHASPTITLATYAHLLPESDEGAAEKVASLIAAKMEVTA